MNKTTYRGARATGPRTARSAPAETQSCARCHDNHGSAPPKLLGVDRGSTSTASVRAITANNNTVCYACHTAASTGFPATVTAPHRIRLPDRRHVARDYHTVTTRRSHGRAHERKWPAASGYAGGDCKNCHDVHGTANAYDELVATYASRRLTVQPVLRLPRLGVVRRTNIEQYYPTSAGGTAANGTIPTDALRPQAPPRRAVLPAGSAMPCYDCHNPHGSAATYGLRSSRCPRAPPRSRSATQPARST